MAWLLCLALKILKVATLWYRCLQNKHIKNLQQWSNSLVVKMLIHNPGVPYSKPLGGSKVDSVFHPSEVERVSGISGNLVAKSKLPPHSGSVALRQLNLFHKKETIKCKVKLYQRNKFFFVFFFESFYEFLRPYWFLYFRKMFFEKLPGRTPLPAGQRI